MTTSVLIAHWNDLVEHSRQIELSLPLTLHALRKQARLRHGTRTTVLLGSAVQWGSAAADLQRSGCRLHSCEEAGQIEGLLCGSAGALERVLLVMSSERARQWVPALADRGLATQLWYTDAPRGAEPDSSREIPAAPLSGLIRPLDVHSVGIYVDWHHIQEAFRQLNVPPNFERAAGGLVRRAALLGDVLDARIYGDWPAEEAASLAARVQNAAGDLVTSGIQPRYRPAEPAPAGRDVFLADLQHLLDSAESPQTWVLVSHHPAIPEIAAAARSRGVRVALWAAEVEPLTAEHRGEVAHYVPLHSVLDLRSQTVALFIDYENVARSLVKQGFAVDPSTLARGLIERARSFGRVCQARAYADWDQFLERREPDGRMVRRGAQRAFREAGIDTVYVLPGPNSADVQLARDVEEVLASDASPESILLASGDGDFCGTVDGVRRRGKEVWVWSVRSATRAELATRATQHEWIEDFLNLEASSPRAVSASRVSVIAREWEEASGREERPFADAEVGRGSALTPWVRMLYQIERLLRANHWTRVAFKRLAAHLATLEEFGPTPANALMWLNRAKAEGMLLVEHEAHRSDRSIRITTCRLNSDHPSARAALEVPDRIIRLLYQMLQKMPWVSFKLLRNVLLREQWLGGPPHLLQEAAVDEWVNYLIADGAISMSKEPNAENPDYPVTALRLNDEHPLTSAVVHQAVVGTRLAAERVILTVDHFLVRNRKPWMAMGALRRSLDGLGREELQEVLQGLQNLGALATDSYPNPQKEHYTTGCNLNPEIPVVRDTLKTRNAIVQVVEFMQRHRSWIPLARVDEELGNTISASAHPHQRLAWFTLLRDESILEFDQEGALPPNSWGSIQCRLKVTDAVVRAVVARNPGQDEEGRSAHARSSQRAPQASATP